MMGILWNLASFVVALGILVAVHEFGHFWVARRCGVKVIRFSIGFGKALYSRTGKDGTEYVLAAIPLGGYVKMLDGRVESVPESEQHLAFDKKNVWQRIAIVAAGPLANFAFAIFAFWLMYLIGVSGAKPVVSEVIDNSPVASAGIGAPFEIRAIGGDRTPDWEAANLALVAHIGESELLLTYAPDGGNRELTRSIDIRDWAFDPRQESPITSIGFKPYTPKILLEAGKVVDGGAGDIGGLVAGDKLIAFNGQKLTDWSEFVTQVKASANKVAMLEIERAGEVMVLSITPAEKILADGQTVGYLGVAPTMEAFPDEYKVEMHYGPIDATIKGAIKTWDLTKLTFITIGKLFTGAVSIDNLSGPISIAKGAGASAEYGLVYFLSFLALISVNLGLINLLPLPVLDGGHLLYYCIELVTGRPVPEKIQEIGFKIGAALLMVLMSVALFNDLSLL